MNNRNYVCVPCCQVKRAPGPREPGATAPTCSSCRKPMVYTWKAIPKQSDKKAWKRLGQEMRDAGLP